MKTQLVIIFLLLINLTFGQKVNISGIVKTSKKTGLKIEVIVNDTINKFIKSDTKNYSDYENLINDRNLRVIADKNGKFEISVNDSDSLYFSSWEHVTDSYLVSDLIKKDRIKINLKPKPCKEYIPCNKKPSELYVFIGEKIKVDYSQDMEDCDFPLFDTKYDAHYKILENLHGEFPKDTIRFISYDHSSIKKYFEYETVLLYVVEYCGDLIHLKYQYNNLYKTTDGKWASPYNSQTYSDIDPSFHIKPKKIEFNNPIEIEFNKENIELIRETYPKPYYEISNGKVKILYGNYPNELFELKKITILKDKGFFE